MTPESAALRSIFFGMTALKKNRFGQPARKAETVAVLGAGLMGAGIAGVSAHKAGMRVLLKDKDVKGLSRGEKQIKDNMVRPVACAARLRSRDDTQCRALAAGAATRRRAA